MIGRAYITRAGAGDVRVVNTFNGSIVATIPVGGDPEGIVVLPNGTKVYVTNSNDNTVSVINTSTNTVIATIPVGSNPYGISLPVNNNIFVVNTFDNNVYVIDTTTDTVVGAPILVGLRPRGIAVTNNPSPRVYITNTNGNSVTVIDAITFMLVFIIPVSDNPFGIAITPDNNYAYVTQSGSNTVVVIDTNTNSVVGSPLVVGTSPLGIAITNTINGIYAYVSNNQDDTVSVIDTNTNVVITTINVGDGPFGVSANSDGSRIFVVNQEDGTVSVIDTATNTVISTYAVGDTPISFGFFILELPCPMITLSPSSLPNGTIGALYGQNITASGGLAPYTFSLFVGSLPPGIGLDPDGTIMGIPILSGTYNFVVQATDSNGCVGLMEYTIVISRRRGGVGTSPRANMYGTVIPNEICQKTVECQPSIQAYGFTYGFKNRDDRGVCCYSLNAPGGSGARGYIHVDDTMRVSGGGSRPQI